MSDVNGFLTALKKSNSKTRMSTMSDPHMLSRVTEFVPTGCLPLDIIMGGGVPVGRSTEIYGDTSVGKSLLAAHILAETQKLGGIPVLFDSETATSVEIMEAVGVDPKNVVYSVPETVEEVYADLMEAVRIKQDKAPKDLMTIVWDSVASTSSDAELEKIKKEGLSGATVATHARLISTMCRTVPRLVAKERIAVVFINQTREKIGVMFGDKMSTFGGRAIGYYASVRLELAKIKTLEGEDGDAEGIEVRCRVSKSKVSPPFGVCRFPILFGIGIDKPGAVLDWVKDRKLIESKGPWWNWVECSGLSNLPKFQGRDWETYYNDNQRDIEGAMFAQAGYELEE